MVSYEIAASTVTTATPERVFEVLDDFAGWPRWMPAFESIKVELPPATALGPGYRFKLRSGVVQTEMEVVEYSRHARSTRFRISFPPVTGMNRCRVQPLDDGRFRIERVDSLDLPKFVAELLDATQRERFARLAGEFVLALKHTVERTHESP